MSGEDGSKKSAVLSDEVCKSSDNSSSEGSDDSSDSGSEDDSDSEVEDGDDKLKCKGKPYSTWNILKCLLHSLLYEIECDRVGEKANEVVHEEMGKGHSN